MTRRWIEDHSVEDRPDAPPRSPELDPVPAIEPWAVACELALNELTKLLADAATLRELCVSDRRRPGKTSCK